MNRTQYLCRLLVPRRLATHHHSPSCYCQIDPQIQKEGMEYWTLSDTGFDFCQRRGCTEPQAPGKPTLFTSGIGNQAQCQGSVIPFVQMLTGLEKERVRGMPKGMPHRRVCTLHHCPPSITSWAGIVRLP